MGKSKYRQPDRIDNSNGSNNLRLSESSEEASLEEFKCQHVAKAINISALRKKFKRKRTIDTICSVCTSTNVNVDENNDEEGMEIVTAQLWICLRCGNEACGRTQGNHAQEHFKIPHSDSHCLVIDNHHWKIYCYECDNFVNAECKKHLLEIVEFFKKLVVKSSTSLPPNIALPSIEGFPSDTQIINNKIDKNPILNNLTKVSGLINYGNTCFFNSVLQCLAQTPYLVKVLQDLQEPGETFTYSGGILKIPGENKDEIIEETLPPIEGKLNGWGLFTSTLCKTLIEMQNSSDNNSNRPSELLKAFKKKTSQCMDGGQHDSHELLRHLLEGVRSEDLKRYRSIILKETECEGLQTADTKLKKRVKYYDNQVNSRLLGPEPVFRGELVSTLECLRCKHSSQRTEPFLDLSLPVMIDKPQPPTSKRKNCGVEDNDLDIMNINVPLNPPLTKHQLKKEKKAARKNRKNRKHRNNTASSNTEESLLTTNSISEENQESNGDGINSEQDDESDADIEDNTEGDVAPIPDIIESGYSSEKNAHPSPTELTTSLLNNSLSKTTTFSEAETDECRSSPEAEHVNRESSNVSNTINDIDDVSMGLSKITMTNNRELYSSPPRYSVVAGDFSIQSCLNQFTSLELMSGSNKVGCEACTARENKENQDNNTNSKMICTPSTKQYLISRVPPVLILHLKRFQSERFGGFRKVTKHVNFPMILDLAPVCKNHKKPKLYSLFGLVEHSGTMYGGHYVAYVKARSPLDPNDHRWSFLPKKNENEESKLNNDTDIELDTDQDPKKTVEPPPGQWYFISDSRVLAVDEATVLKQEAYLLFYERIL